MNKGISVFLPTRKGSERVINKNTRPFAGIKGGLLRLKLEQLLEVKSVSEIVLSTNDKDSINVAETFENSKLKIVQRPEELALSMTNLQDLISYVPSVCSFSHILWTHVTSPFTSTRDYENAIQFYLDKIEGGQFDSLMSGKWFQNFLWAPEENIVLNKKSDLKWPRTQDLKRLFEVDSAIFLANKIIYQNERDRVGKNPFLFEQIGYASFDIDRESDFKLAEKIFQFGL